MAICSICGGDLPDHMVIRGLPARFGPHDICWRCYTERFQPKGVRAHEDNPLSRYSARELFDELKRRGYNWEPLSVWVLNDGKKYLIDER